MAVFKLPHPLGEIIEFDRVAAELQQRDRNEPVSQLTPHTKDVSLFLDRALQKDLGFIGTESRLRVVISTLADLVTGASHDPEVRLSHLREERTRIDDEIGQILRDGGAKARYEPTAVRERFRDR